MISNLVELLREAAELDKGIYFIESTKKSKYVTYVDLYNKALQILCNLQQRGIAKGDEVILQIEENETLLATLWACILGGIIVIPLAEGNTQEQQLRVLRIRKVLKHAHIIVSKELSSCYRDCVLDEEKEFTEKMLEDSIIVEELIGSKTTPVIYNAMPEDTAMIVYSSGSTGNPKGVVITHEILIKSNLDLVMHFKLTSQDISFHWMPLTHMVGFSFCHLVPMLAGMNQYFTSKELFLANSVKWLAMLCEAKATLTMLPNFAMKHILSSIHKEECLDLDLSSVRLIASAGEAIVPSVVDEFFKVFEVYGLKKETFCGVYGSTETQSIACEQIGTGIQVKKMDRRTLGIGEKAKETEDMKYATEFVCLGKSVGSCAIRISNDCNEVLADGVVGNVEVKGHGVTPGYYQDLERTHQSFTKDGWYQTGDIGVYEQGRLTLVGRKQEVVIMNAVNYHLNDIERCAKDVEIVAEENIGACCIVNEGNEEIILVVETKKSLNLKETAKKISEHIHKKMGLTIYGVGFMEELPGTSTGKVNRNRIQELFKDGSLSAQFIITKVEKNTAAPISLEAIEQKIIKVWKEVLEIEEIDPDKAFLELGGQSISVYGMLDQLSDELGVSLNARSIFNGQSVKELAKTVEKKISSRVR